MSDRTNIRARNSIMPGDIVVISKLNLVKGPIHEKYIDFIVSVPNNHSKTFLIIDKYGNFLNFTKDVYSSKRIQIIRYA